jgi:uncharacterized membrane protein YphA (DoxX/SURF4 family)
MQPHHALAALRVALGLFVAVWGVDKLVHPAHGAKVATSFYGGMLSAESLMPVLGVLECALGLLVVLGLWRRLAYPALALVMGATLLGVWRSVLDPLALWMSGGNPVFFSSLPLFCAVLVVWALRTQDALTLDARHAR